MTKHRQTISFIQKLEIHEAQWKSSYALFDLSIVFTQKPVTHYLLLFVKNDENDVLRKKLSFTNVMKTWQHIFYLFQQFLKKKMMPTYLKLLQNISFVFVQNLLYLVKHFAEYTTKNIFVKRHKHALYTVCVSHQFHRFVCISLLLVYRVTSIFRCM